MTIRAFAFAPKFAGAILLCGFSAIAHADLFGITWDNGDLYSISTANAQVGLIGNTGIPFMGDMQLGSDGFLYAFDTGRAPKLYKIDPTNARTTVVANLGINQGDFVFEGSLYIAPDGTAFASSLRDATNPSMFTIDLATGAIGNRQRLGANEYDFNGWTFDFDSGDLVGIDREENTLDSINISTGAVRILGRSIPTLGETGGMTFQNGLAYFATGGPGGAIPGSNELWSIDFDRIPEMTRVGAFNGIGGKGFSAIAAPEPSSLAAILLALGGWRLAAGEKKNDQACDCISIFRSVE